MIGIIIEENVYNYGRPLTPKLWLFCKKKKKKTSYFDEWPINFFILTRPMCSFCWIKNIIKFWKIIWINDFGVILSTFMIGLTWNVNYVTRVFPKTWGVRRQISMLPNRGDRQTLWSLDRGDSLFINKRYRFHWKF